MKKAILLLCVLATSAFANPQEEGTNHQEKRQQMFEQFKQMRISSMESRIEILQTGLNCVKGAQKHEDMKACDETLRTAMRKLEDSHREKMQSMKESMQPTNNAK